jgi:16S rRNA (cytosine1402-N4)-methyltransferase
MATRGTHAAEGAPRGTVGHVPVLLPSTLEALAPQTGATYIDATFGAGGHSAAILAAAPSCRVLGIDRDPAAIAAGRAIADRAPGRLQLAQARFSALETIASAAGLERVDGVLFDLGVSSMQLDQPERGFSFLGDGPLDMRMSSSGPTAADILNTAEQVHIAEMLLRLGEEKSARAIARRIVSERERRPFARTSQLANLVVRVLGREKIAGRHAATRTFQALRMYVNDELGELAKALAAAERILHPGGRLVVISFHSLEDRLVKHFLKRRAAAAEHASRHLPPRTSPPRAPSFAFLNQRPVSPGADEIAANPRARSAKLRAARRTDAPAWPEDAHADAFAPR